MIAGITDRKPIVLVKLKAEGLSQAELEERAKQTDLELTSLRGDYHIVITTDETDLSVLGV